jgi:hypothetical protein
MQQTHGARSLEPAAPYATALACSTYKYIYTGRADDVVSTTPRTAAENENRKLS